MLQTLSYYIARFLEKIIDAIYPTSNHKPTYVLKPVLIKEFLQLEDHLKTLDILPNLYKKIADRLYDLLLLHQTSLDENSKKHYKSYLQRSVLIYEKRYKKKQNIL